MSSGGCTSAAARAAALGLALAAVLAAGCTGGPVRDEDYIYYRVKRGDTLYSIAWRYALDYHAVAALNGLSADDPIHPGQVLRIQALGAAPPGTPAEARAPRQAAVRAPTPAVPPPRKGGAEPVPLPDGPVTFRWATQGDVVQRFASGGLDRQGIDIAGSLGQPVVAAADGRVVYSGNGLPDYGNLVIIKHDSRFLSAYAHNQKLHVEEGAYVKSGQRIADMGQTGTGRPKLHFQIRKNGRPVDPLKYLPAR